MINFRKKILYSILIFLSFSISITSINAEEKDNYQSPEEDIVENQIIGDMNSNGSIDHNDAEIIVDNILEEKDITEINDVNKDNKLNINDSTNIIYKEETDNWNNNTILTDNLKAELTTDKEKVNVGEEININLHIKDFDKNIINGIEGNIEYNQDKLMFLGIDKQNTNIKYGDINNKNKFVYILDNYNEENNLLAFRFKALDIGLGIITLNNLILSSNGLDFIQDKEENNIIIMINKNIETPNNKTSINNIKRKKPIALQTLNTIKKEYTSYAITDTGKKISIMNIKLSNDNTIKSLIIKNHKIKFSKDILEYNINIDESTKKLDIKVILNDEKATYEIIGNKNFKEGNNKVCIAVTAEDGSVKNYIINANRKKTKLSKSNSSRNVIIVLLILIIVGLIYIIFKDDEEDE